MQQAFWKRMTKKLWMKNLFIAFIRARISHILRSPILVAKRSLPLKDISRAARIDKFNVKPLSVTGQSRPLDASKYSVVTLSRSICWCVGVLHTLYQTFISCHTRSAKKENLLYSTSVDRRTLWHNQDVLNGMNIIGNINVAHDCMNTWSMNPFLPVSNSFPLICIYWCAELYRIFRPESRHVFL